MSQTLSQMQVRIGELLGQIRPMQADYDRLMKLWIASERHSTEAYAALAQIVADNDFGPNEHSLRALMRYHDADIALLESAHKVGAALRDHGRVRDELRNLMNRVAARLTYELSQDLTSDETPHLTDRLRALDIDRNRA